MKTAREVDKALETAGKIAGKYGHVYISTEHMLLGMFKNDEFAKMLISFGVQLTELQLDIESHVADAFQSSHTRSQVKTQALERVFNRALTSVLFSGREMVNLLDIFISIMGENSSHSSYFLMKYNVNKEEFMRFVKQNTKSSQLNKQQMQYLDGVIDEF